MSKAGRALHCAGSNAPSVLSRPSVAHRLLPVVGRRGIYALHGLRVDYVDYCVLAATRKTIDALGMCLGIDTDSSGWALFAEQSLHDRTPSPTPLAEDEWRILAVSGL